MQKTNHSNTSIISKSNGDNNSTFSNGYALLIGVGSDLPMTVKDVNAINDVLTNPEMAAYKPKEHVKLLTEEKATKKNILDGLGWLIKKAKSNPEATIFIYYSGHGGSPKKGDKDEYYLLPYDYIENEDKKEFRLSGKEWIGKINKIKAQKIFVTLDCCHAEGVLSKGEIYVKGSQKLIEQLGGGKGRVVLASCKDDELSYARPHLSVFTEIFLEAMKGIASKEEEYVAVIDVVQHVLKEVPKRARILNKTQTPVLANTNNLDGAFTLCKHNKGVSDILRKELSIKEDKSLSSKSEDMDKEELKKLIQSEILKALLVISGKLGKSNGEFVDLLKEFQTKPQGFSMTDFRSRLTLFVVFCDEL